MASKLNSDAEGYDLVMFAYSGKTMIGKLYNYNKADAVITNGSVIMTMLGTDNDGTANLSKIYDNYFIIDNPC